MHIASTVKTPLLALFGPTVPEFGFAPFRCESTILQVDNLKCRPCHPHGYEKCPLKHFRCMKEILPETLVTRIKEILNNSVNKSFQTQV